ncbi:MAG: T9SS type A sorting domain-containing protein [Ignavibacteria bacterium]
MKKVLLVLTLLLTFFLFNETVTPQVWTQKLAGISMWALGKDVQGNLYAGASGTVKSVYKSTDGGLNWTEIYSNGLANFLSIACDSSGRVFIANGSAGVLMSTNSGQNFTLIPSSTFGNNSVQSVWCGKNGYVYVGTVLGGIYISTDYGVTFPTTNLVGSNIVYITTDRYNSQIVYAGASAASGTNGIFRSTDAGMTFGPVMNSGTSCWGIVQTSPNVLLSFTTTSPYPVLKSTDGGLNWTNVFSLTGAMRGATLDIAGNIYCSGNGGVFRSTNGGQTFNNFNFALSSNQSITYLNRILVATSGTSNGGVWITIDSSISSTHSISTITPSEYKLEQNYPNPFNSQTRIQFALKDNSYIELSIFDLSGRLISEVYKGPLEAGTYESSFNATNLSSGIYFYILKIKNQNNNIMLLSKKMALVK